MNNKLLSYKSINLPLVNLLFFAISIINNSAARADNGGMVGGGTDPVRTLFFQAREKAASLATSIDAEQLNGQVSPQILNWIVQNHAALSWDITQSQHEYAEESDQTTCAHSEFEPAADIYLRLDLCRAVTTPSDAARILIHESAHHLGITSEDSAEAIAAAIMNDDDSGVQVPDVPLGNLRSSRITCKLKLLEGEDQHPFVGTYIFDDPHSPNGAIHQDSRRISLPSGNEQVSQHFYLPIVSQGYPRIERDPNGAVEIFASYNGEYDSHSRIPEQYSMAKFKLSNLNTAHPTLSVELFYARGPSGDEFIPDDGYKCSR